MTITLKPESEQYLRERAHKLGLQDPGSYVEQLLERDRHDAAVGPALPKDSPGRRIVERLAGTATRNVTTEGLMAETRSEV